MSGQRPRELVSVEDVELGRVGDEVIFGVGHHHVGRCICTGLLECWLLASRERPESAPPIAVTASSLRRWLQVC